MPGIEAGPRSAIPKAIMTPRPSSSSQERRASVPTLPVTQNTLTPRELYIQTALDRFRKLAPLQQEFPPLQEIPVNTESLDTAYHEVDHGLLIYFQGGVVTEMTVVPGPGYLGLTTFAGLNERQTQIAAMASSVLHGRGTGGDVALARLLEPVGMSIASAESVARSELNKVPVFMRDRIAQMVAWFKTVNGEQFSQIMARAAIDAEFFGLITPGELDGFLKRSEEHTLQAVAMKDSPDQRQIIDIDTQGNQIITKKIEIIVQKCPKCGLPMKRTHTCSQPDKRAAKAEAVDTADDVKPHPIRRGRALVA